LRLACSMRCNRNSATIKKIRGGKDHPPDIILRRPKHGLDRENPQTLAHYH
jgi:hypothetical protein